MNHSEALSFDASEQAILDRIDGRLHAQGWAEHVTTARLLRNWQALSTSVKKYRGTVDDYTNDLNTRDALQVVLRECKEPLHSKLLILIEQADGKFLAATQDDTGRVLRRYFRISESSEWWWKRTPTAGPLAEYLNSGNYGDSA